MLMPGPLLALRISGVRSGGVRRQGVPVETLWVCYSTRRSFGGAGVNFFSGGLGCVFAYRRIAIGVFAQRTEMICLIRGQAGGPVDVVRGIGVGIAISIAIPSPMSIS